MPTSAEKSIFLTALEKGSERERSAYLNEACAGDDQLRASVSQLLKAHERNDNPIDEPPVGCQSNSPSIADDGTLLVSPGPHVGDIIGPYRLKEKIGEGGFGIVFVAEQQVPVKRMVALKVIRPGMDTRDVIARFEAERQAVAMMDHTNIARVLDAGMTDSGRPYFVMELIRGVPITEFCDAHQITTRERLELFVTVCRALQHAHQKGIIHRDLKPQNVLVTLHDGVPVAKVIDFGVAKAIGRSLTDKTIYTRFTAMIGTPLYMSPEQAEMSGLDVDTRSDIYSLGVLLYELLTGATPFDRDRIQSVGFDELRRIIREEDPPRPSTRFTTQNQAFSTVATKRKLAPTRLSAMVRGDLDWIVMKAIEKDRTRRYDTAKGLAQDVLRFLHEEPVVARPPATWYRFQKFARRNRVAITTGMLIAAAMIVGTCMSIWQARVAVRAVSAKDAALSKALVAQQDADDARKEVEEFAERLKQANLLLTSGRVHADAGRWSEANAEYTKAIEIQPNYYLLWLRRGSLYVRLGLWDLAASDYAKALELNAPVDGAGWWGIPQLMWHVGDKEGYAGVCVKIGAGNDGSLMSMNAIRSCMFGDRSQEQWDSFAERTEQLVAEGHRSTPGRDVERNRRGIRPPPPNREGRTASSTGIGMPKDAGLYVAAWAQYRAGDVDAAIDLLERVVNSDRKWPGRGICQPLLAMAYQRAGRSADAKASLDATNDQFDRWADDLLAKPIGGMPIPWFDWIEFVELRREATLKLTGVLPAEDPRLAAACERHRSSLVSSD